jgi:SnoaL-like domain
VDAPDDLLARIDRLESLDQIRQLPAKYALSLDMRDFDAMANLFVDDVGVPGKQRGRQALKRWYADTMRRSPGSAHGVHGQIIDFETPDLASGVVYSRNDLDLGEAWMIELMIYLDRYERRDGVWYFQRRTPLYWYETDMTRPPVGEKKLRIPGYEPAAGGFHDAFPSWAEFWDRLDTYGDEPVAPPAPLYRFLETFRRGEGTPRVNPKGGSATPAAT